MHPKQVHTYTVPAIKQVCILFLLHTYFELSYSYSYNPLLYLNCIQNIVIVYANVVQYYQNISVPTNNQMRFICNSFW